MTSISPYLYQKTSMMWTTWGGGGASMTRAGIEGCRVKVIALQSLQSQMKSTRSDMLFHVLGPMPRASFSRQWISMTCGLA